MVRRGRQAFTLIEILVVIGIILILIGISVIGFQHLDKVASEKATRTRLDLCNSVLSDYEATTANIQSLEGPNGIYTTGTTCPMSTGASNPGDVNLSSYDRYSQKNLPVPPGPRWMAVPNTGNIIATMMHVPSVKSTLGQLPGAALLPSNQSNGGPWIDSDGTTIPGTPLPGIIVDGWKNPIIFVPSGGLPGVIVNLGTSNQRTVTVRSVDGRPFWASAGQDGNFMNGDDNIYSTAVTMK